MTQQHRGHREPRPPSLVHRSDLEAPQDLAPLLTAQQVAQVLGVGRKRVYELGIPAVHISRKSLRWRRVDLEMWIETRRGAA